MLIFAVPNAYFVGTAVFEEGCLVRKKIKWVVLLAVVVLVIVFAPVPIPHFTDFTSVYDKDGHEADVTIKVCFVHFKPLFFQYGTYEGFPVGSVKVYDNSAKEEICDLRFNGYLTSASENTYMATAYELDRRTVDKIEGTVPYTTNYTGNLIWDESFDNVVLPIVMMEIDLKSGETTYGSFAYMASKKDLTFDELTELFYISRGVILYNPES